MPPADCNRIKKDMDELSDTELMALVKEGDYRAFDALYERYRGPVQRFLFALIWDAQAAEDGLQEVFVGLFNSRADYVPTAKLSTYLFQIARNYYLGLRRKRGYGQEISLSGPGKDGADPFAGLRANEQVEPEIRLMQGYRRWRIRQAIQSLPESQQLVFVIAHFEDMKYAEIAEVLNVPVGTVKSRMFAAVRSLQALLKDMDALGLSNELRDAIEHLLHQPGGLLMVTGPTDAGKSVTLYAMLQEVNNPALKVMTIQKTTEYRVDGTCQSIVRPGIGYTFSGALRSYLRMDPDVVMLDDVPDEETARLSLQLALTGHLVIAALDTNDALFAIQHLRNMGMEDVALGTTLIGVVAQRQVRKVCEACKQEYIPAANDPYLRALGITAANAAGRTLVRAVGCEECRHTGYRSRTNLFEVLTLTREMTSLIANGADLAAIAHAARAAGHRFLREDGRQKVLDGVTTPEEVIRVLA